MSNLFIQRRKNERGNVLWFILVAIVLLGAITILLSRSGSSVDQSGDVEQARIKAGQVMRYVKSLENAVQDMLLRGVSESDISFENGATATDYTNAGCASGACLIFDAEGGGIPYRPPPSGANDGSQWIFTGANNVGTAASPAGTTSVRTGNDLLILMPGANASLCLQINRDLGVGTPGTLPEDAGGIDTAAFTGTYANTLTILDGDPAPFELDGKSAGCFTDTDASPPVIYFYYVLLAR